MKTKVTVQFLSEISRAKKVNSVRYWLAMRCFDEKGAGWVHVESVIPKLADLFEVKPKTVWNMLWRLENEALGNFGGDKFFLYNEKRLAEAYEIELTSQQAVWITLDDLRGSIVKSRATFDAAILASKEGEKTITRGKRRELTGRSRTTQIKYDRVMGTGTRHNFAIVMDFDEWWFEYFRLKGEPVFELWYCGRHVIARGMPNTYSCPLTSARKRISTLRTKAEANRVFFDDFKKALKAFENHDQDVFYTSNGQWMFVPQDILIKESP